MRNRDLAGHRSPVNAVSGNARKPLRLRLLASAIGTGLMGLYFAAAPVAQAGTCTWDGTNNNWTSSGDWTGCNGTFAGTGASTGYDALVGNGTANINTGGINAGALTIGVNGVSAGTVRAGGTGANAQFGSVNVVWGTFDVNNGASVSTSGDLTNSNNGTVTVDQAGGQGGSTLNIGGAINNSNNLWIGNSNLSAATVVTAQALNDNTGNANLSIIGSAANQASLKIAGTAGFGTAGLLTGGVTLQGNALLQFGSGGITSIANGGNLDLNGANAQMNIAGHSGPNSALTGLAVNNYSFNLENGASLTTTTGFTNNNHVQIDYSGGDGGSTFNVGGVFNNGNNELYIGDTSLGAATSVTAQGLNMVNGGAVTVTGSATNQASLKISGAAGFGTAGVVTGYVGLTGDSLLQFGSGGVTSIANGAQLNLSGANAQLQIAGNNGNNSGLTGLNTVGGTLALADGATLATTSGLTIAGGGVVNVGTDNSGGSSLAVGGTITNNSILNLGNVYGFPTAVGVSAQAINNNSGVINVTNSNSATDLASLTIAGPAGLGTAGVVSGQLNVSGNSLVQFGTGALTSVAGGAQLSLQGSGAQVQIAGNGANESALTKLASNDGQIYLQNGVSLTTTTALNNSGSLNVDNNGAGGSSLTIGGTLTNTGGVRLGGTSIGSNLIVAGLSNTGSGDVEIYGGSSSQLGTMTINGAVNNSANVGVQAYGNLVVAGSANAYTQTAGTATVYANGSLTAPTVALNGGVLQGTGTVTGNVSNVGGTITGGTGNNQPGTLTISGNLVNTGGGTIESILSPGGNTAVTIASGSPILQGGTIQGNVVNGLSYAAGQTYTVMNYAPGSLNGVFGSVQNGANAATPGTYTNLVGGLTMGVVYNDHAGNIQLVVVNTPLTTTETWNGGTGNWNTGSGWSSAAAPQFYSNVAIGATSSGNVTLNQDATISSLAINAGNTLAFGVTPATLAVGGNVTVNTGGTLSLPTSGDKLDLGGNFNNAGTTTLAGGSISALGTVTNSGTLGGFGTVNPAIANTGLVNAAGGTLTAANGITGTGNITVASGATLDLSHATSGSSVGTLTDSGAIALGSQNLTVSTDYNNGNSGGGNSFNKNAGVTGSGQILAAGNVAQAITGPDVTGGTTANATLAFGNVHMGTATNANYAIDNTGTSGPSLRGAIQTTVNGGNITDGSLSGNGVTAGNFGPVSTGGQSSVYTVTYAPTTAGALTGQAVHIANNFNNVGEQTLAITGAAYAYADPTVTSSNGLNFGVVQVGQTLTDALTIKNVLTASNAAYQEGLNASFGTIGNPELTGSGSITNLAAGQSNAGGMVVTFKPINTGSVSGTVEVNLASNGAGTSGLGITNLAAQNLGYSWQFSGTVVNQANPNITPSPINLGNVRIGSVASQVLSVANVAGTPPQASLDAQMSGATGAATLVTSTPINQLAAGQTNNTSFVVGMNTATAGAQSGSVSIALQSDSTPNGCTSSCIVNLPTAAVSVSGNVYRLANPTLNTPSVTLAARVGDSAPTASLSVTNTSPDAYTEGLAAGLGAAPAGFTTSGSISNLAAQGADASSLKVGLNTATAGSYSGNVAANFTSNGLIDHAAPISVGSQNVALTGDVYTPAQATVNTASPIAFGIVHVGDGGGTLSKSISVTNSAQVTALNDTLLGSVTASGAPFTGTGSLTAAGLAAQQSSSALGVNLSTATAGIYNGSANLAFASHDSQLSDLALSGASVGVTAQVNRYAALAFSFGGGVGTLTQTGANSWMVNFGNVHQNTGTASALLNFLNNNPAADAAFTDLLSSNGTVTSGSGFSLTGDSVTNLAGGATQGGFDIGLGTSGLGNFNELLSFNVDSSNADFNGNIGTVTLDLEGSVVSGVVGVPEPGSLAMFLAGLGLLGLLGGFRRVRRSEGEQQ